MRNLKNGFTLAEVLVTLGIIGVVAALTTPALIQNVGDAKIAPKLQKANATFETAAEMMLNANDANSILTVVRNRGLNELSNYMKISYNETKYPMDTRVCVPASIGNNHSTSAIEAKLNTCNRILKPIALVGGNLQDQSQLFNRFDADDGITYWIEIGDRQAVHENFNNTPNNQLIGVVAVDINSNSLPNRTGKDIFPFLLYNDGTLRPYGGINADRSSGQNWNDMWNSDNNCVAGEQVKISATCTGSIFENGMKVVYTLPAAKWESNSNVPTADLQGGLQF